jgi:hypothetical protein
MMYICVFNRDPGGRSQSAEWTLDPLTEVLLADPHKISGSLPEELQLTETVELVAHVSGKSMACYTDRNWQIRLLCGSA